ncbi:ABC transporter permease [Cellulomonas sp. SLBN-39]|uniref:ABC transporter permease n=1 Tax=Cellulomonas sp. SLBN-39 TaxID=2768446 RepID=UPI0011500326|nr:ABC transporter permease [Cellulomonas sp. SLBN-39]TQL03665.1 teichoic acid transport system permease protein [Cellulomonas sp. SLBN-39]
MHRAEASEGLDPALVPEGPRGDDAARAFALTHGLRVMGGRPRLRTYVTDLLRSRSFVWELARGVAYTRNQDNRLGQLWLVINPLLSVGAYFLVFGLLLQTDRGIDNYVAFLTVGVFIFAFVSDTITVGSRSILRNQGMIRALRFPRAALPLSATLTELLLLLPAMAVLLVILLLTGEPLRWTWLLIVPAMVLLLAFCSGLALVMARVVSTSRDLANLVPVIMRIARYVSGVFFSVGHYGGDGLVGAVLQYQPIALFLDLVRSCLMVEVPIEPLHWAAAAGYAVVTPVVGFVYFWRGEGRYGRG